MSKASEIQTNSLKISEDVITKIVEIALNDIEGVYSLTKSRMHFVNLFSKTDAPSAISINLKDEAAEITVNIIVTLDCNVKNVSEQVQFRIKNDIQNMTGIAVAKVNVIISGISFSEK